MKGKKEIKQLAAKYGVLIQQSKNDDKYWLDAPLGFVFSCDCLHALVCTSEEEVIERLSQGIEKCEEHDCEVCEEGLPFEELIDKKCDLIYLPTQSNP